MHSPGKVEQDSHRLMLSCLSVWIHSAKPNKKTSYLKYILILPYEIFACTQCEHQLAGDKFDCLQTINRGHIRSRFFIFIFFIHFKL